jgi:hypothetical protein
MSKRKLAYGNVDSSLSVYSVSQIISNVIQFAQKSKYKFSTFVEKDNRRHWRGRFSRGEGRGARGEGRG